MANDFYRQLGLGVASLAFGVALSVFIYAAASGAVVGTQAWLLFATSFLLMLRFWWRYSELFVQFLPSKTFWHFLFDFGTSFFGILSVLAVGNMQTWALLGALAMLSSIVRSGLSWKNAGAAKSRLKRTLLGAVLMLVVMVAVYALATAVNQMALAISVFIIIVIFVIYSSKKP